MRVLVTGADGFTGRYVVAELAARGHEVRELHADLTDARAVMDDVAAAPVDAVIHLAGRAFVADRDFAGFYLVNQIGTFHLLDALATAHPAARAVLASSATVYGATRPGAIDETLTPNPTGHYALSKWAMERGATLWADRLAIAITRPFNYTGVGQDTAYLIPKIVDHFRRGEPRIELGALDVRRDFGDVRDASRAYVGLIEHRDALTGVFNIATGQARRVRELVAAAARVAGREIEVQVDPGLLRRNEIELLIGDNAALQRALPDWRPRPIEQTIAWMMGA